MSTVPSCCGKMQRMILLVVIFASSSGGSGSSASQLPETCSSPLVLPEVGRLVAIGDIHGDLDKLKEALELAKVWDHEKDEWVGGETVLVQLGDQVDRGDDELAVTALLRKVSRAANAAGGAVHVLLGNHEIMCASGDVRYATAAGNKEFDAWNKTCSEQHSLADDDAHLCELWEPLQCADIDVHCKQQLARLPPVARSRFLSLRAGGPIAKLWAKERRTLLIVGDTLFVHGGIALENIDGGCSRLSEAENTVSEWMEGKHDPQRASEFWSSVLGSSVGEAAPAIPPQYSMPDIASDQDGPFWNRELALPKDSKYGNSIGPDGCKLLDQILGALPVPGVKRMVVGHTVQLGGIFQDCGTASGWSTSSIFRVDVGMSQGMLGSRPEVLEIRQGGSVNILKGEGAAPGPESVIQIA